MQGGWESHRRGTRLSSFSWESERPIHWDPCAKITWGIFDGGWEFGVRLRNLPMGLAVAQNLMFSLLLAPSGLPSLPSILLSMKRQPLNASCFKLTQAGTVFYSAVCVYAGTMCPTLFGTLCCSIAPNNFSRFLVFFPVTPSFSVAWQSYCPCSDFTVLLYWNTLKLVFQYFMHVKTFVNLVKIKRNSSLIYFSLKPKKYSH